MSQENIDFELNADDLDTAEFWKSRDESTKITLNEKLLRFARTGPSSEFISLLEKKTTSINDDAYSIDLDITDKSGWSALIHASFNGHLEIVERIISYQEQRYIKLYDELVEINDKNEIIPKEENEKLEESAEEKEKDIIIKSEGETYSELKWKYLFKEFISRQVKWNGSTALHLSCARGHESIVKLLINKMIHEYNMSLKYSINACDYDMATPLHCAVLGKHYNICKLLLINGGIVTKSDIRGKTPLDWAEERGLNQYIRLLKQYAAEQSEKNEITLNENEINEAEKEKMVESIWNLNDLNEIDSFFDDETDSKLMEEAILSDDDIINVVINNQNVINHHNNNFVYSAQPSNINNIQNYNQTQFPFNNHNAYHTTLPMHLNHRHTHNNNPNTYRQPNINQWCYNNNNNNNNNRPNIPFNNNNNNNNNNRRHYQYPQRAPRHQRYFNNINQYKSFTQNNNNSEQSKNLAEVPSILSIDLPPIESPDAVPGLFESKSCPEIVGKPQIYDDENKDKMCDIKVESDKNSENENDNEREGNKVINDKDNDNNPAYDAMKFQNKYLKARCETLDKEHKELATEYKGQLMKENYRWKAREAKLVSQLNTKQKQIHELRHTLRRLRMFLDSLPVKVRRNFYRNNGNFSKELCENQIENNNNNVSDSEIDENGGGNNNKENDKYVVCDNTNVTNNGWRTVITKDNNNDKHKNKKNKNGKNKHNQNGYKKNHKMNHKSHHNINRRDDIFLFSKAASNAAKSRKCIMSDKSWRRKN